MTTPRRPLTPTHGTKDAIWTSGGRRWPGSARVREAAHRATRIMLPHGAPEKFFNYETLGLRNRATRCPIKIPYKERGHVSAVTINLLPVRLLLPPPSEVVVVVLVRGCPVAAASVASKAASGTHSPRVAGRGRGPGQGRPKAWWSRSRPRTRRRLCTEAPRPTTGGKRPQGWWRQRLLSSAAVAMHARGVAGTPYYARGVAAGAE
ncbi:hypothetical protein MTO96_018929 [Rhipicephalus appendiculatus]